MAYRTSSVAQRLLDSVLRSFGVLDHHGYDRWECTMRVSPLHSVVSPLPSMPSVRQLSCLLFCASHCLKHCLWHCRASGGMERRASYRTCCMCTCCVCIWAPVSHYPLTALLPVDTGRCMRAFGVLGARSGLGSLFSCCSDDTGGWSSDRQACLVTVQPLLAFRIGGCHMKARCRCSSAHCFLLALISMIVGACSPQLRWFTDTPAGVHSSACGSACSLGLICKCLQTICTHACK